MISTAFWYDQILFPFPWDTPLDFYHNHLLFVSSHINKLMIHLLWQVYTPMTQHCPHHVWQIMQYPLCHMAFLTFATFCSVTSGLHLFIKPLYLHLWKHLLTVDFGDMPFSLRVLLIWLDIVKGFSLVVLSWTAYSFFLRKHQIIDVVAPDTHFIIKEQNNRCHMAINFFLSQLSNYFWDSEDGILWMKYVYTQICILLSLLFFIKRFLPRDNRSEIAILLKYDMKQLQLKDKQKQKHFI